MQIKQLQIAYAPEHDRILMRIHSGDNQEVRCWLTRRMVQMLVPSLNKMMQDLLASDRPLSEEGRKALLNMNREAVLQHANFQTPFQDELNNTPLGAEPLLITHIELRSTHGNLPTELTLKLSTSNHKGFEMRMAEQLQHGFANLLLKACEQAQWGLAFIPMHTESVENGQQPIVWN
jgi:hypothetical protein